MGWAVEWKLPPHQLPKAEDLFQADSAARRHWLIPSSLVRLGGLAEVGSQHQCLSCTSLPISHSSCYIEGICVKQPAKSKTPSHPPRFAPQCRDPPQGRGEKASKTGNSLLLPRGWIQLDQIVEQSVCSRIIVLCAPEQC